MPHRPIVPPNVAKPIGPYSPGTKAGDTLYISGTVALDKDGNIVGVGDIAAQTRAVIETIKAIVEAGGGALSDVAYNAIFLKDMADYKAMNDAYREYFGTQPPARYVVRADLLREEFLIEITSIAHLPEGQSF